MYCLRLDSVLQIEEVGAKAANLSVMLRNGFSVPPGFVVTTAAYTRYHTSEGSDLADLSAEIASHLDMLAGNRVMVRSSAIGEDSKEASFAGQLDSFQSARTIEDVIHHLEQCWSSSRKENVLVYQQATGITLGGMGVIVQDLVDPDIAGVLFTRAPDNKNQMLCEFVEGHGEKLVSGEVNPGRFRSERDVGVPDGEIPFDFRPLYDAALRLEALFSQALDIEWVLQGEEFSIVQSRPITRSMQSATQAGGGNDAPKAREGANDRRRIYWSNTNVNENYPGPITPFLYSIARESYYHYFKNLSQLLGLAPDAIGECEPYYANIIGAFGCRMYYNMTSIHTIIGHSPFAALLRKSFDNFVGYQEGEKNRSSGNPNLKRITFLTRFTQLNIRLNRNVETFERRADEWYQQSTEASDLEALRRSFHGFIEIRMHGWYRASLADFFAMVHHGLLGMFCKRYFHSHQGVHNKVIQAIPGLASSAPIIETWKIAELIRANPDVVAALRSGSSEEFLERMESDQQFASVKSAVDRYLDAWGFRCSGELMLTEDNFCDAPEKFIDLLRGYVDGSSENPEVIMREKGTERRALMRSLRRRLLRRHPILFPIALVEIGVLEILVRLCFNAIASRERVRLKQALLYHGLKRVVQQIGAALVRDGLLNESGDLLYLRYQEVAEELAGSDMLPRTLKDLVALRQEEFKRLSSLVYPDDFSTVAGEVLPPEHYQEEIAGGVLNNSEVRTIRGLSACGGYVKGRVRVLQSVMELGRLRKGDILVTRQTDPGWATVFPLISGLIVERGGMLSHGAIVAREFGIPAIIGIARATEIFLDNDIVELNGDTGEIHRVMPISHSTETINDPAHVSDDGTLHQTEM